MNQSTAIMKGIVRYICCFVAMFISSLVVAQSLSNTTFNLGDETYYIHKLNYIDLSDSNVDLADGFYNQNMIADNKYIYVADHTDKYTETNHLKIKLYDALTGYKADNDLIISHDEIYDNLIDYYYDDEQRCFYLVECNDDEHLIMFLNTSYSGENEGIPAGSEFYFYLIKKDGTIEREFEAKTNNLNFTIMDFGVPKVIGNPVEGNFNIIIPMVSDLGKFSIIKYTFVNYKHTSISTIIYMVSATVTGYTKPSIDVVDDTFLVVDDRNMSPSLYSYKSTTGTSYGELSSVDNAAGNGCFSFDLNGHRILCTGDIYNDSTQIDLGLWDYNATEDVATASFDGYSNLTSIKFGPTTYQSKRIDAYAYRQFIAVSDYNETTKHLHIYVPGEFLATYQINRNETVTNVGQITQIPENSPIQYHISDNQLIFEEPVGNIIVYNLMGNKIFQSIAPVKSINLTNFVSGAYIISMPQQSLKILL